MDCSLPGPPSPLSRSRWQRAVSVWAALLESVVPRMSSLRVRLGRRICRGRMAEDGRTARRPGFSRQEYWSGLPFHPPGDLPKAGLNQHLLHWQVDSLPLIYLGSQLLFRHHLMRNGIASWSKRICEKGPRGHLVYSATQTQ